MLVLWKPGHTQVGCYKRKNDEKKRKETTKYASIGENGEKEGAFVMQHETSPMTESSQRCIEDNMWYVDCGASNHMTGHSNWFESLKEWKMPRKGVCFGCGYA